jgi:hypothetical protein
MLNRGWYCLMKFCSTSSASVSDETRMKSTLSIASTIWKAPRVTGLEKWLATRFLMDFALPT